MKELDQAVRALEFWIEDNGWSGYDPYDVKANRAARWMQRSKLSNRALNVVLDRFPITTRRLFGVQKLVYSKAMGLFADAYLNRYELTGHNLYLFKAEECLSWLSDNCTPGYSGYCWGYPFDWQSLILIPKGTPSGVVSSVVLRAFLHAYRITAKQNYLDICSSICKFILNDLNRPINQTKELCFSYTPLDDFRVHNANMFCAASLIETAAVTGGNEHAVAAKRCLNYTMRNQREDGAWYYWGPPELVHTYIDNYHTGFVLECAHRCKEALESEFIHLDSLERGLEFYRTEMFLNTGLARMSNTHTFPVDIHGCAQGIQTLSVLEGIGNGGINDAIKVAHWTIKNMQDESGFFYYRQYKRRVNRMPFIRWGQAWMMLALSTLQLALKKQSKL